MISKIIKSAENPEHCVLIYSVHDEFTKKQIGMEFCLIPNELLYNATDSFIFLKVVNTILSLWFSHPLKGAEGTYTFIEYEMLNERIIELTDKSIQARNIFNKEYFCMHGKFELVNIILNERSEFVALDARFYFGNLGKLVYRIGSK